MRIQPHHNRVLYCRPPPRRTSVVVHKYKAQENDILSGEGGGSHDHTYHRLGALTLHRIRCGAIHRFFDDQRLRITRATPAATTVIAISLLLPYRKPEVPWVHSPSWVGSHAFHIQQALAYPTHREGRNFPGVRINSAAPCTRYMCDTPEACFTPNAI